MATGDKGSGTHWLGELKAGDPAAAQRLWARYFTDWSAGPVPASGRRRVRRRTKRMWR